MTLLIQPRDPLIVRDGRPFSAFPGAKARGYRFPPPQTIAGAVRGRIGSYCGYESDEAWRNLQSTVAIRGPLLYDLKAQKPLFPAPLDALLLARKEEVGPCEGRNPKVEYRLYRLAPGEIEHEALTDLPEPLTKPVMAPEDTPKDKPASMPAFWHKDAYFKWLLGRPEKHEAVEAPEELGIHGPQNEYRTHVKITPETQTAEESMLFETSGLEFLYSKGSTAQNQLSQVRELALWVHVEGTPPEDCPSAFQEALQGVFPLGGERRLTLWQRGAQTPTWFDEPPKELLNAIKETRQARLLLLTPADFNLPGNSAPFLPEDGHFGGAKVIAAAVGRPLTVSGWDLLDGKPKPSRRLAPAGSVYFVDLAEVSDIDAWVMDHWMKVLAEQPDQSRRDGYGLVVTGVWRP